MSFALFAFYLQRCRFAPLLVEVTPPFFFAAVPFVPHPRSHSRYPSMAVVVILFEVCCFGPELAVKVAFLEVFFVAMVGLSEVRLFLNLFGLCAVLLLHLAWLLEGILELLGFRVLFRPSLLGL